MDQNDPRLKPEALLMVGDKPDPFTMEGHLIMAVMAVAEREGYGEILPRKVITDTAQAAQRCIEMLLAMQRGDPLDTFSPNGDGV